MKSSFIVTNALRRFPEVPALSHNINAEMNYIELAQNAEAESKAETTRQTRLGIFSPPHDRSRRCNFS
jgi:3'-phosphoadenosine 5'-phosphosulfate sulfotransferase (PAPS reductase)/FAD synthetase